MGGSLGVAHVLEPWVGGSLAASQVPEEVREGAGEEVGEQQPSHVLVTVMVLSQEREGDGVEAAGRGLRWWVVGRG